MAIFIGHETALEYWRLHFGGGDISASRRQTVLPVKPPEAGLLQAGITEGLTFPLHIMLGSQCARRKSQSTRQHVFSTATPSGCFLNVGDGLMVSSPEFCFLQMAEKLPLVKLIELGYELCGTYSRLTAAAPVAAAPVATAPVAAALVAAAPAGVPTTGSTKEPPPPTPARIDLRAFGQKHDAARFAAHDAAGYVAPYAVPTEEPMPQARGFNTRPPLTGTKKLEAFLARMPGTRGHQKAARALRYIVDGAASPMEAKLAIFLTLPYKLGGYHFPLPKHNSRIVPGKTAKRSAEKDYYACDLYWPDFSLGVEYDSDRYHTGSDRIADDSKRRNALAAMGITVITVTRQQIHSVQALEKIARVLAGHMGRRLTFANPSFAAAHRELRKLLAYTNPHF